MTTVIGKIKHYRYLLIPLIALMILSGFFPTYCRQRTRPEKIGSEYLNLAVSIQRHIKSIDEKISDEFTFGTRPFKFDQANYRTIHPAETKHPSLEAIFAPEQVRGIAFRQDKPLVFIGQRVLKEGDWIGGFKIGEINRASFTVTDHSGKQTRIQLNPLSEKE